MSRDALERTPLLRHPRIEKLAQRDEPDVGCIGETLGVQRLERRMCLFVQRRHFHPRLLLDAEHERGLVPQKERCGRDARPLERRGHRHDSPLRLLVRPGLDVVDIDECAVFRQKDLVADLFLRQTERGQFAAPRLPVVVLCQGRENHRAPPLNGEQRNLDPSALHRCAEKVRRHAVIEIDVVKHPAEIRSSISDSCGARASLPSSSNSKSAANSRTPKHGM